MSLTPRKYNRAIQSRLSRSGSFDSLQNALQQRPPGLPIVSADDVLQGRVEIFEREDQEGPKPKYFHQNYLLIQNNGQTEYEVIARILDALVVKDPSLLPSGQETDLRLTKSPTELFNYGYLPVADRDGVLIPRGTKPVPDETIVRFFNPEYYRWLFAVDEEGQYTFNIDNGDGLTPTDYVAYQTAMAEAREDADYRVVYDYWRKAHPRKLRGITQIPHGLRKHWMSLLDNPDDIAIIMLTVSPALEKFNEHRLIIRGLEPLWSPERIKQVFSRYSSSKNHKYPIINIVRTKDADDPWRVEMTFDPSDHEGMFANLFFNALSFIDINLRSRRRLECRYAPAERSDRGQAPGRYSAPSTVGHSRSPSISAGAYSTSRPSSISQSASRPINISVSSRPTTPSSSAERTMTSSTATATRPAPWATTASRGGTQVASRGGGAQASSRGGGTQAASRGGNQSQSMRGSTRGSTRGSVRGSSSQRGAGRGSQY